MEKPLLYMRLRGPIASFRYPYLLVGRQPTYLLPPLSTIYGLLQAAYGKPYDPSALGVGYLFHAEPTLSIDLEKAWFLEKQEGGGKRAKPIKSFTSNVLLRELRVDVTLELFLTAQEASQVKRWRQALRSPKFWLTLGRSHEMVSVEEVTLVDGESQPRGDAVWAGPSLFPLTWMSVLQAGYYIERMPVYISPDRQQVEWRPCIQVVNPLRVRAPWPDPDHALFVESYAERPPRTYLLYLWPFPPPPSP